jgi:hypothetical protein
MTGSEALREALRRTGSVEGAGRQVEPEVSPENTWPTAQAIEHGLEKLDAAVVTAADLEAALVARAACAPVRAASLAQELLATINASHRLV